MVSRNLDFVVIFYLVKWNFNRIVCILIYVFTDHQFIAANLD